MWTCPKCREEVDDDYEVCWSCGTTVEGVEDPAFFEEASKLPAAPTGAEMPDNLVIVAKYLSGHEAYAMRERLADVGIPAFIIDEFSNTVGLLSSTASGGAKVQVPEHLLRQARDILGIKEEEEEAPQQQEQDETDLTDDDEPDEGDAEEADNGEESPETGVKE